LIKLRFINIGKPEVFLMSEAIFVFDPDAMHVRDMDWVGGFLRALDAEYDMDLKRGILKVFV